VNTAACRDGSNLKTYVEVFVAAFAAIVEASAVTAFAVIVEAIAVKALSAVVADVTTPSCGRRVNVLTRTTGPCFGSPVTTVLPIALPTCVVVPPAAALVARAVAVKNVGAGGPFWVWLTATSTLGVTNRAVSCEASAPTDHRGKRLRQFYVV
jgi:hypothetical protein